MSWKLLKYDKPHNGEKVILFTKDAVVAQIGMYWDGRLHLMDGSYLRIDPKDSGWDEKFIPKIGTDHPDEIYWIHAPEETENRGGELFLEFLKNHLKPRIKKADGDPTACSFAIADEDEVGRFLRDPKLITQFKNAFYDFTFFVTGIAKLHQLMKKYEGNINEEETWALMVAEAETNIRRYEKVFGKSLAYTFYFDYFLQY